MRFSSQSSRPRACRPLRSRTETSSTSPQISCFLWRDSCPSLKKLDQNQRESPAVVVQAVVVPEVDLAEEVLEEIPEEGLEVEVTPEADLEAEETPEEDLAPEARHVAGLAVTVGDAAATSLHVCLHVLYILNTPSKRAGHVERRKMKGSMCFAAEA